MSSTDTPNDPVVTSYAKAPTRTITAGGVTYAYRELGPKGGIPVVFFVHLAATLDNWDPRIIDPIAKNRHVITFDNRGVGASTGQVPDSIEAMADDAYTFIKALGFDKIDIFSFSLGGMIAQDLVLKHPDLVRKLVLTGTGPRGGKDIDKVVGTTYWDILRATLTRVGPQGVPVLQPQRHRQARREGVRQAPPGAHRRPRRADQHQGVPDAAEGDPEVRPLRAVGPVEAHPAHPDRQRRQRPHGAVGPVRGPAPAHQGIRADHLPRLRATAASSSSTTEFAPVAVEFLAH